VVQGKGGVMDDKERIAKLEAEVAELKARVNPPSPPKFEAGESGPTTTQLAISRVGMSPEVFAEFARAIPVGTIRAMQGERLAPRAPSNTAPPTNAEPRNTSGWRDAAPLSNPPGVALIDRMVEVQDARERAELIVNEGQRLAKK
jgi:hypothetical protein